MRQAFRHQYRACRSVLNRACQHTALSIEREVPYYKMDKVNVRFSEGDEMMTISFTLGGKEKNMSRPKKEAVEKPLGRLQMSLQPKPDKKAKRGKTAAAAVAPALVDVVLYRDEQCTEVVRPTEPNITAWTNGGVLAVGADRFKVYLNPPFVAKLSLHGRPMTGFPLLPIAQLENAADSGCLWLWERQVPSSSEDRAFEWVAIGKEACYTPHAADVGRVLRATCTPTAAEVVGDSVSILTDVVEEGPVGPGELRAQLTQAPAAQPVFRVVTYNILADQYASMEYSQAVLFKHVPPAFLDVDYRKQLVLKQLLRYNADILCLQEVDRKVFESYLLPHLSRHGYDGFFTCKVGKVQEGSSLFFRSSRFKLRARRDVDLPAVYTRPLDMIHAQFQPMLSASQHLRDALSRVTTIAQLALLCDLSTGQEVAVANTHLFFHANAPHIRTMHVAAIVAELQALIARACSSDQPRPAVMLCGDLNSDLNDGLPGALSLLQHGKLGADFWDWAWGADFSFGRDEGVRDAEIAGAEAPGAPAAPTAVRHNTTGVRVTGVDLDIPFRFRSSDDLKTPWTNYVPGYRGLLDYIWCDAERIAVHATYAPPDAEELGSFLPNQDHPSDHLAVIADISILQPATIEASAAAQSSAAINVAGPGAAASASSGGGAQARSGAEQPKPGSAPAISPDPEAPCASGRADTARPLSQDASDYVHAPGCVMPVSDAAAAHAAQKILEGGVIAVPTDTLYGLAAQGDAQDAIQRIYAIKGRAASKPLAISVASVELVQAHGQCEHLPEGLLAALLPGPVTVLLERRADAPLAANLNAGVATIGVRVPDCGFLRKVCEQVGTAIVLTSANVSGASSTVSVGEFEPLWGLLDGVYDGGFLTGDRRGSTIIDLSTPGGYRVVRDGSALSATVATLARFGISALEPIAEQL